MNHDIADESRYDPESVTNSTCTVNDKVLKWWHSLSQYQKYLYCDVHPKSDLTKGHLTNHIWDGWDKAKMQGYHKEQAADLKVNLLGATAGSVERKKLKKLYKLQLKLAE